MLFLVAGIMARAQIPADIIGAVRVGRMTAFRKRTGPVRGIVAGDALRRLIARTIAQDGGSRPSSHSTDSVRPFIESRVRVWLTHCRQ